MSVIDQKKVELGFSKAKRLNLASDYANVFKKADRISDRFFTILVRKNILSQARLGLVIAKKKVRKASKRNQIKRLIRESFRLKNDELGQIDIVVLCNPKANRASKQELATSIQKHWVKLAANE